MKTMNVKARKSLKNDQSGLMYLLLVFIIIAIGMVSIIGYSISMTQSIYQQAGRTLERAGNISVIITKQDENIRDINLGLTNDSIKNAFEQNLLNEGLVRSGAGWEYDNQGRMIYSLQNINLSVNGDVMQINAQMIIPLLWNIGQNTMQQDISVQTNSKMLYFIPG